MALDVYDYVILGIAAALMVVGIGGFAVVVIGAYRHPDGTNFERLVQRSALTALSCTIPAAAIVGCWIWLGQ